MTHGLSRLLNPRSILTVGGRECERVVAQCRRMGFDGRLSAVHPTREHIGDVAAVRSIAEVETPDATFVAVPAAACVEVVRDLARAGCGGAIVYAADFAEAGHDDLQHALVEAAGEMPILGPNCYGLVNAATGAALWPDVQGCRRLAAGERGVALVAQSSNVAINLSMQARGLPLSHLVTVGNAAQTGLADIANALLEDESVAVLALHVEGLGDAEAFAAMARCAHALGKPVAVLKVGESEAGEQAALTHTAALTGGAVAQAAFLDRLGCARVQSVEALLEAAKLLLAGPLEGRRIISMSCSGGEAGLMADGAARHGLTFPPFPDDVHESLTHTLGPHVTVANPLDYHTFVWGDAEAMGSMFDAALAAPSDLAILVLDWPREGLGDASDWTVVLDTFRAAVARSSSRAAILSTLPETMPEEVATGLLVDGIAPLCGIDHALAAVAAVAATGPPGPAPFLAPPREGERIVRSEVESKRTLAAFGLVVPEGAEVESAEEARTVATRLGGFLVVKTSGPAHKSDDGGVRLNLDADAAARAAADLLPRTGRVLVERMAVGPSVELLVGVSRDPVVGLMLTLGAGGVLAEVMDDTATLLLPAGETEIRDTLASLRIGQLLDGHRGVEAVDIDALVANIACIQRFASARHETLSSLDVNPLLATQYGSVAVDALIEEIE